MDPDTTGAENGKRASSAPPDASLRLEALLRAMPDLLFVIDCDGRICDYHSGGDDQLYLPADRFLGRNVADVLPEPAAGLICGALKTAAVTARRQSVLYALPFPDGERWFEASIAVQGDPRAPASRLVFLARDVTARKRAETALRESEEKYRLLTEGMKDVVWVLDVESRRFTYVSPSVKNLRGYTADEVRAQPLEAAWTPEERERLFHLLQGYVADFLAGRITEETYVSIEFHQPCKDGSAVPSEAICHLVRSRQTGRLELHGVTRDVAARARVERALRESETRFAEATRQSRAFVWEVDAEGRYMFVTPVVEDVLGYRPEELAGRRHFYDLHPAKGRDEFRTAVFAAMERREKFRDYENPMVAKDGRTMWVSTNAVPLLDKDGALLGYRGVDFDVTARKLAEDALRESEARTRAVQDNLPDGLIYQIDSGADGQARRFTFLSQGVERLHGVSAADALLDPMAIYGQVLPEDLRDVAAREAEAAKTQTPLRADVRVRLPSGEIRWRRFTSAPRRLPNGHLVWDGVEIDVTERKLAEESLRESDQRLRALNDNLPGGLVYQMDTGVDGRERNLLSVSKGVEQMHGVTVEEALSQQKTFYLQIVPEDQGRIAELEARAIATLTPFRAEVRCRMPTGEIRWIYVSSAPRRLPNGHLVWDGIEIDVTERKHAEEALRESEARFAATTQASRAYVWEVAPDGLVTFISPMVEKVLGRRPEEIVGQLHFYDLPPQEDREQVKRIGLEAMARRETIRGFENRNVAKDGRIVWLSSSANPLFGPDGTFRGYQGIDTDITARKQAEEALRESEARFAAATQASRSFVWEVDPAGLYTHVGDMVADVLGYRPADLIGKMHFYDLLPPESRAELKQACLEMMARRESPSGFENANVAKDGRIVWVSSSAHPLFDAAGSFRGYQGIDTDVTERKRAEEALKTSETRYRGLIDFAVDGILLGSPDGVITEANACMCALAGRTRQELVGKHVAELFDPQTMAVNPMRFDLVRQGETVTRVRKLVRPDTSEVFVEIHSKLMPDGTYQSIFHDITARRQAEEALRLSEAKFRNLHETMRDAFATVDLRGRLLEFNVAFRKLTGYSAAELRNRPYQRLTPRKWHAAEAKILKDQVLPRGYSDVYEKEFRRKDGTVVPVELRTILIRDAAGRPTGMWASIRDVTERKRAEDALRASETKYRLLFENMRDAFAALDLQGQLIDCNPAFENLLGYSRKELLRLHLADVTPKEWMAVEKKAIAQMRRRGYSKPFEKEYVRKDGVRVPVELQGSLIRDARGRPAGLWAIIRDVSERKRAERELRQAHDELERRVRERTAELAASQLALAESEEQFRQMAENAKDAFWLIEARTQKVLYVSPAFERIWNRPVEMDAARWFAHIHPDDRAHVLRAFRSGLRTGIPATVTYRLIWPDGSIRWIESSGAMIRDARNHPSRAAGLIRDITDQRRLEAEILQATETERQRLGRDLHDSLGQALTAIGYLADAVREDLARAKRPEADDVRKLGRLIGQTAADAHALARGLLLADVKRGGLAAALQELAFRTQELFGIACRYAGPGSLPPLDVQAAGQLYRIAQEAATNAAKHGRAKHIEIRLAKERRGLLLSVRDSGRGLPARKKSAPGLGLDIMRYRAGLIGATLSIDSQPRRGTTVNCLLPRAAPTRNKKP